MIYKNYYFNNVLIKILIIQFFIIINYFGVISANNYFNNNNNNINNVIRKYLDDSIEADITYGSNCTKNNECKSSEICTDDNICSCLPYHQYDYKFERCLQCPDEGEICYECCRTNVLRCINHVCIYCENGCPDNSAFMDASRIALAAALIMGITALAMLLYRIFLRPQYFSNHDRRNARCSDDRQQSISGASITSIQVRVLARLRDRPPRYETQHNYDNSRLAEQQNPVTTTPNNPTSSISIIYSNEAPPSYGDINNSSNDIPPPYTDLITSTDSILPITTITSSSTSSTSTSTSTTTSITTTTTTILTPSIAVSTIGIINHGFINTEIDTISRTTNQLHNNTNNTNINNNNNNTINNETDENIKIVIDDDEDSNNTNNKNEILNNKIVHHHHM